MSRGRLIDYERLATPRGHLETLIEPAIEKLIEHVPVFANGVDTCALRTTRGSAATSCGDSQRYDLIGIRESLRARLGLRGLAVMTGHQCEFFHAGVLAKTLAAAALAERLGGESVFLAVDSDLPKSETFVAPFVESGEVLVELMPIPGSDARLAVEDQPLVAVADWRAFFENLRRRLGARASMVDEFARGLQGDAWLGEVVLRGQRNVLESLGTASPTVIGVSRAAETPEFRQFAAYLAANAEKFAECYNEAQRSYRRRHRVRNVQRPAPLLRIDEGRVELPLWIFRPGEPRRRLFVERTGDCVVLYAEAERAGFTAASPARGLDESSGPIVFEDARWRVRPRALALTAFARLCMCDVFIHGIGGAKYDEMTEDFTRSFFGVELAPACCVTATARLPLPSDDASPDGVLQAVRALRDIRHNPQRFIDGIPQIMLERRDEMIRRSDKLRASAGADRRERREVFDGIRAVNAEMLGRDSGRLAELREQFENTVRRHLSHIRANDREYFYALHSRDTLSQLTQNIRKMILGA